MAKTYRRICAFYKGQLCWIRSAIQVYIDHSNEYNLDDHHIDILRNISKEIGIFLEKDIIDKERKYEIK